MSPASPSLRSSMPIWLGGALYACVAIWLALRTRVFMDEIWLIEWGRVLLDPTTTYSMYMFADGSSLKIVAWFGPILSELLFRLTGSVSAFRIVNILALLVVAASIFRLARNHRLETGMALLLAAAVLLDPTLTQSVVLGRPDALALMFVVGGMALADIGRAQVLDGRNGWTWVAVGYASCVFALSIWISAVLLGPLVVAHWLGNGTRLHRGVAAPRKTVLSLVVVPLAVALTTIDIAHIWAVRQAHAANPLFTAWSTWDMIRSIPELLAVSLFLVLPGLVALSLIRPRWVALMLFAGMCLTCASGFYPFRVPYLLMYCIAATTLLIGQSRSPLQLEAWRRYLTVAVTVSIALMALRIWFALINEVRIAPQQTWLSDLPAAATVGDYSWDFYESGRHHGLRMVRSYPGDGGDQVHLWLTRFTPDVVVRAVDATGTWVLVDDLDDKLQRAGYCPGEWIDALGRPVSPDMVPRPVPSPLLWRLGLYRDYGPYALWRRCE